MTFFRFKINSRVDTIFDLIFRFIDGLRLNNIDGFIFSFSFSGNFGTDKVST